MSLSNLDTNPTPLPSTSDSGATNDGIATANTPGDTSADADSRLAVARRLYAYGVALVAYIVSLAGVSSLISILDQSWFSVLGSAFDTALHTARFGAFFRDSLAANGGLLLVAVPLFLFHWGFAQRLARRSADEAGAGMRKFFLYVALVTAMVYTLTSAFRLLTGMGILALGGSAEDSGVWPTGAFHALMMIVLGIGLTRHWAATLWADGDYGIEDGMAGFWRRLYQTAAGLISLVLLIGGGSMVINTLWQIALGMVTESVGGFWWRTQLVDGIALLLIGGYLLRLNWRQWRAICQEHLAERARGLRRFYLYVAVIIGALATLVPAAGLLEEALNILFAAGIGDPLDLLNGLGEAVSLIPLGFAVWMWHWRYLQAEEATAPESAESVAIRRVYYYAVAATGLALVWFGAVEMVQAVLDRLLIMRTTMASDYWTLGLARGLSLLIVGAPIWAFHWRAVEQIARQATHEGAEERASAPRRIYLYGVALVGALLILAFLAQVAYRGFLWVLGDPDAGFLSPQAAGDLARSLIAAGLWIIHVIAIRADSRMGTTRTREKTPTQAAAGADEMTRPALMAHIGQLENELAAARARLEAMDREKALVEQPPDRPSS